MNEEDYNELRQEERYEEFGGEDSGYCGCGKELNDEKLCTDCDTEEINQLICDGAPEEIGRLAL